MLWSTVVPALLAALSLSGCTGGDDDEEPSAGVAGTTVTQTVAAGAPATDNAATSSFDRIPEIVEELQPSVVSVALGGGEGSGVIVDADTIVTNAHVVGDASGAEVALASGRRLQADVEAVDRCTDLAVLSVRGEDLPGATFAEKLPRVGELAVAMGNPLGFEQTVTAGIVSGLHRQIPSSGRTPALIDLIQTDAPISPGNSGGALVNEHGEVIGINVAYIPPGGGAVSIGFAIPAATVTSVVRQLEEAGRVEHAYLGVFPTDLTPQLAARFGIDVDAGVLVTRVPAGSPAAEGGVEAGDVVVSADGEDVEIVEDLLTALRERDPGDTLELEVVRGGERERLAVALAARPQGCP